MVEGGDLMVNSYDLAASQSNPVWVKFEAEADAAYIGLTSISPGEAVRQVTVEGVPNSADIILDFDSSGRLLGIEVLGARAACRIGYLPSAVSSENFRSRYG
jgi:uncharacterized protein YuzE